MFHVLQSALRLARRLHADERGSASVEYVGLALVVSMVMASVASAVDAGLGRRIVTAVLDRVLNQVAVG